MFLLRILTIVRDIKKAVYKTLKRFTRSALKPKIESINNTETAPEAAQTTNTKPDRKVSAVPSALTTSQNKLELKMSKKIVVSKKPMTVNFHMVTGTVNFAKTCSKERGLWHTMPMLWQLEGLNFEVVDPIEQITKRCIRIVKDIEAELSGCALCRY